MNAMDAHVKAVLSVDIPMTRNAMPRMRNALDALRLFNFMEVDPFTAPKDWKSGKSLRNVFYFGLTSSYGLGFSNKPDDLSFKVASKKDSR